MLFTKYSLFCKFKKYFKIMALLGINIHNSALNGDHINNQPVFSLCGVKATCYTYINRFELTQAVQILH